MHRQHIVSVLHHIHVNVGKKVVLTVRADIHRYYIITQNNNVFTTSLNVLLVTVHSDCNGGCYLTRYYTPLTIMGSAIFVDILILKQVKDPTRQDSSVPRRRDEQSVLFWAIWIPIHVWTLSGRLVVTLLYHDFTMLLTYTRKVTSRKCHRITYENFLWTILDVLF